jgi:hypothetical protein
MFIYLKVKIFLKQRFCLRRVVFYDLDFVEVNNCYVSICKEAILGNCSTNECKFIIFVLKNFNGKSFHLIITNIGVQILITLLQQIIIDTSHLFFSFHISVSFSISSYKQVRISFFLCLYRYINTLVFLLHSYTH